MGPKVEFFMLPFIKFGYMSGSGHEYILKTHKRYRAPRDRAKKKRIKRGILSLGPNLKKGEEI